MRTKLKIITVILMTGMGNIAVFARHGGTEGYLMALGVRGGPLYGITFKDFVVPNNAFELIGGSEWKGYSITALYEYEKEFLSANSLFWFIGAGVNMGAYEKRYYLTSSAYASDNTLIEAAGIDAIVGLEYRVRVIPLSISLDYKPFYNVYNPGRTPNDYALSLRYIFK
jgi:hypothetical protein